MKWFGNQGGQRIEEQGGRLGSPALRIGGTRANPRPGDFDRGCHSVILHPTYEIANRFRGYVCAMIKARRTTACGIYAEGHKGKGPDGNATHFPAAFAVACPEQPSGRWQCVSWSGRVPRSEEMPYDEQYDFSKDGTWVVMVVRTEDPELLIDSIEIGTCS